MSKPEASGTEFPKTTRVRLGNRFKQLVPVHQFSPDSLIDFNRLILFGCIPEEMKPLEFRSDLMIHQLTHRDLAELGNGTSRFSEQARLYYSERGIDTAYGAYMNDELVHMSWVYSAREYAKEPLQRLILNEREVEIVNCFTVEKCRGLGIYPYAIQFLSHLYFRNGNRRVYMMAHHNNYASQSGIVKAGFKPLGRVTYLRIPRISNKSVFYRRSQFSTC